jgi:hypothetical protein
MVVDHLFREPLGVGIGLLRERSASSNSALGFCNDSPALLLAAAAYLRAACEHEGTMPMTAPSTGEACAPPRERAAGNGSFADARHCRCAGKAV